MRDGDSLESARKTVQQLEEEQKKLLATLRESLQLQTESAKGRIDRGDAKRQHR